MIKTKIIIAILRDFVRFCNKQYYYHVAFVIKILHTFLLDLRLKMRYNYIIGVLVI